MLCATTGGREGLPCPTLVLVHYPSSHPVFGLASFGRAESCQFDKMIPSRLAIANLNLTNTFHVQYNENLVVARPTTLW